MVSPTVHLSWYLRFMKSLSFKGVCKLNKHSCVMLQRRGKYDILAGSVDVHASVIHETYDYVVRTNLRDQEAPVCLHCAR